MFQMNFRCAHDLCHSLHVDIRHTENHLWSIFMHICIYFSQMVSLFLSSMQPAKFKTFDVVRDSFIHYEYSVWREKNEFPIHFVLFLESKRGVKSLQCLNHDSTTFTSFFFIPWKTSLCVHKVADRTALSGHLRFLQNLIFSVWSGLKGLLENSTNVLMWKRMQLLPFSLPQEERRLSALFPTPHPRSLSPLWLF